MPSTVSQRRLKRGWMSKIELMGWFRARWLDERARRELVIALVVHEPTISYSSLMDESRGGTRRWATGAALVCVVSGFGSVHADVSAGGTSPGDVTYSMTISPSQSVCVGQMVVVQVAVNKNLIPSAGPQPGSMIGVLSDVADVPVVATVADPSIVGPARAVEITDIRRSEPGIAQFAFTSEKAGETTITFTANLGGLDLPAGAAVASIAHVTRTVHVRACVFTFNSTSNWQFTDSGLAVAANVSGALLSVDSTGQVNATVRVIWGSGNIGGSGCLVTETIDDSTAVVTGSLADSGLLSLHIDYAATTVRNHIQCPHDDHTATVSITPGAVEPIGSEYLPFIDRLPHSLTGLGQSKAGEMLYVVAPVKVK